MTLFSYTTKWYTWKKGLVQLLVLLLLISCDQSQPQQKKQETKTARPDTLVLAIGGEEEQGYDPTMGWGRYGAPLFQSTLLGYNDALEIEYDLATAYTISEDRHTWQVEIRKDALFSDGAPLTAYDVAYTFTTAKNSGGLVDLNYMDQAVATGEHSISFHLSTPRSTFIHQLCTLGIVPQHAHGKSYGRTPMGSGPYKMVRWDEGQQLIVEANPLYYGKQPAIKRLVFLFLDPDTAFAAAQAGTVQVAAVPQILADKQVTGMRLVRATSVDNRGIMFPCQKADHPDLNGKPVGNDVTADPAIRQAINYAIDRQALVKGVLNGFGTPAYGSVSHMEWEEKSTRIQDNNLEKAAALLKEAGWQDQDQDGILDKNGLAAEFTLLYPADRVIRQSLALAVADMVAPLGIRIKLSGKSWDEIRKVQHAQAVLFGWGSYDPTEMYHLYHSQVAGQGYFNPGLYRNTTVDTYLEQALAAASPQEAAQFWQAVQWDGSTGVGPQGDAPWAWLVNLDHTYLVNQDLDIGTTRVEPHGHGWPITANITDWHWRDQQEQRKEKEQGGEDL
jgi:peptide/nickel transport system substrate-binding protein